MGVLRTSHKKVGRGQWLRLGISHAEKQVDAADLNAEGGKSACPDKGAI